MTRKLKFQTRFLFVSQDTAKAFAQIFTNNKRTRFTVRKNERSIFGAEDKLQKSTKTCYVEFLYLQIRCSTFHCLMESTDATLPP